MMNKEDRVLKKRAQVKSRWYYIFWGTATLSVLAGQLYVGSGYRIMAGTILRILNSVEVETQAEIYNREKFY